MNWPLQVGPGSWLFLKLLRWLKGTARARHQWCDVFPFATPSLGEISQFHSFYIARLCLMTGDTAFPHTGDSGLPPLCDSQPVLSRLSFESCQSFLFFWVTPFHCVLTYVW